MKGDLLGKTHRERKRTKGCALGALQLGRSGRGGPRQGVEGGVDSEVGRKAKDQCPRGWVKKTKMEG